MGVVLARGGIRRVAIIAEGRALGSCQMSFKEGWQVGLLSPLAFGTWREMDLRTGGMQLK